MPKNEHGMVINHGEFKNNFPNYSWTIHGGGSIKDGKEGCYEFD